MLPIAILVDAVVQADMRLLLPKVGADGPFSLESLNTARAAFSKLTCGIFI